MGSAFGNTDWVLLASSLVATSRITFSGDGTYDIRAALYKGGSYRTARRSRRVDYLFATFSNDFRAASSSFSAIDRTTTLGSHYSSSLPSPRSRCRSTKETTITHFQKFLVPNSYVLCLTVSGAEKRRDEYMLVIYSSTLRHTS